MAPSKAFWEDKLVYMSVSLQAAGKLTAIRPAHILRLFAAILLLALGGCNTPTKAIDSTGNSSGAEQQTAQAEEGAEAVAESDDEGQPKIVRQPSTVSRKGTNIRAVVNGEPITNFDVQRRAAFLKLRRVGGDRSAKALEELTEEKIKMQEAARRRVVASDSEVNTSFASFAKSNRMSAAQMSSILNQSGVTSDHFKEFIRSQISWNRAVGSKFRSETTGKSAQETMSELRDSGGRKPETNEYLLEQVIFVVPEAKRNATSLKQRKAEATAFRQQFIACGQTVKQAAAIRDVTVRTLSRTLEPQLPPDWKDDVVNTPEGGTTNVRETEKGIEFLAVCSKKSVSDDNAARVLEQEKEFESFNDKGDEFSKSFLAELKSKSKIIYR